MKQIADELGPIEVLVNNAGITRDAVLHRMTPEQWGQVIATNLTSCFNMCRLVIDGMRERGFGRIVNIGSINGQAGQYGQVNYAAAKSGIHGFTKALAQEGAAKGITVNAIAPGYIDTEMVRAVPANVLEKIVARIPVGRLGHAPEIARGVLVPRLRRGGLRHRLDPVDQRRPAYVLSGAFFLASHDGSVLEDSRRACATPLGFARRDDAEDSHRPCATPLALGFARRLGARRFAPSLCHAFHASHDGLAAARPMLRGISF